MSLSDREGVWSARVARARSLLRAAPPLDRTQLLCSWALSPNKNLRRLAAATLDGGGPELGGPSILSHLARDSSPDVRRLVASCARRRRSENPILYGGILRRLAEDPDLRVRREARGPSSTPAGGER